MQSSPCLLNKTENTFSKNRELKRISVILSKAAELRKAPELLI